MALTDIAIKKTKPREKAYALTDGSGLYLWLTPAGGKLWRWSYRFANKEKVISYGKYPDVSLLRAREKHAAARTLFAEGIDPMAQRKEDKIAREAAAEHSFQKISEKWLAHWRTNKSPRHVDYVVRRLESDVYPALGARPVAKIQASELVALVKVIQNRGARDIAKRALETTGQILRYAVAHGYAARSPASDIRPSDILTPSIRKNYARLDAKEFPGLLRSIEVYQGRPITRLALKLMALSFVRTSELILAKWSEIDFMEARWDIPAARMKMRTRHIVPLATQSLEVLGLLKGLTGHTEWLFPGDRSDKKPMSNNTILKALERMGYKTRMTGHGFRGLASTILHERGYNHEHIELQLAHAPRDQVSASYNHAMYLEPRTKLMQEWADLVETMQRGAAVLPIVKQAA